MKDTYRVPLKDGHIMELVVVSPSHRRARLLTGASIPCTEWADVKGQHVTGDQAVVSRLVEAAQAAQEFHRRARLLVEEARAIELLVTGTVGLD